MQTISRAFVFNLIKISLVRRMMATEKRVIHVRRVDDSEQFQVNLKFNCDQLNVNKSFNFNRSVNETLEVFLDRVKSNVSKIFEKKAKRKKKKEEEAVDDVVQEVAVTLFHGAQEVDRTQKCVDVFFTDRYSQDLMLKVIDSEYSVAVNHPWVLQLTMPKSGLSDCPLYPKVIKIFNGHVDNSDTTWHASTDYGKTWKIVGQSYIHYPSKSEVGALLKFVCKPGNGKRFGPEVEAIVPSAIQEGPILYRKGYSKSAPEDEFRVVSYNLLADLYAETDAAKTELFAHCLPYALTLDYRKPNFIKEILGYKADITCLQEVDTKVFEHDLEFILGKQNYTGVMAKKQGNISEGVATFFNHQKFRLVEDHRFVFSEEIDKDEIFDDIWSVVKSNENLVQKFKDRGTVLQVSVLESIKKSANYLVVGNTHLYFHPTSDHIRLLQAGMSLKYLDRIMKHFEKNGKNVSMIFCGDFNSTPDSGVYELMTNKLIPADYKEWSSVEEEKVVGLQLKHDLSIKSSYEVTPEFPLTNYTPLFAGCLDYIYYTDKHISVNETLELPDEEFLKGQVGLPNPNFPSDHLAICSTFKWE